MWENRGDWRSTWFMVNVSSSTNTHIFLSGLLLSEKTSYGLYYFMFEIVYVLFKFQLCIVIFLLLENISLTKRHNLQHMHCSKDNNESQNSHMRGRSETPTITLVLSVVFPHTLSSFSHKGCVLAIPCFSLELYCSFQLASFWLWSKYNVFVFFWDWLFLPRCWHSSRIVALRLESIRFTPWPSSAPLAGSPTSVSNPVIRGWRVCVVNNLQVMLRCWSQDHSLRTVD